MNILTADGMPLEWGETYHYAVSEMLGDGSVGSPLKLDAPYVPASHFKLSIRHFIFNEDRYKVAISKHGVFVAEEVAFCLPSFSIDVSCLFHSRQTLIFKARQCLDEGLRHYKQVGDKHHAWLVSELK